MTKQRFFQQGECTAAHGYACNARLCTARVRGQGLLWIVKSDDNSFGIYFDDSRTVTGASCVKNVALLEERKIGAYKLCTAYCVGCGIEQRAGRCRWRSWLPRVLEVFSKLGDNEATFFCHFEFYFEQFGVEARVYQSADHIFSA